MDQPLTATDRRIDSPRQSSLPLIERRQRYLFLPAEIGSGQMGLRESIESIEPQGNSFGRGHAVHRISFTIFQEIRKSTLRVKNGTGERLRTKDVLVKCCGRMALPCVCGRRLSPTCCWNGAMIWSIGLHA